MPEEIANEVVEDKVEQTLAASTVRSKDFATLYSNYVQCGFTAWDIRVNFGLVGTSETGVANITEQTSVVLAPAMAKALANVLANHVRAYESQNGEIQMPQSVMQEAQARAAQMKAAMEAAKTEALQSEPAAKE